MKRTTLASVALTATLSAVALPSHAFFGLFSKNDLEDMLPYVPAESALFFGGVTDEALLGQMDSWFDEGQTADLGEQLADMMGGDSESPGIAMLQAFLTDYYASAGNGVEALYDDYGFAKDGASVFYMDGIYPVMRIAMDDSDALLAKLEANATSAGYEMQTQSAGSATLNTFELLQEENVTFTLGLATHNDTLTISVFSQKDDEAALKTRFAVDKPDSALTKADWKSLGDTYSFDENLRGYISLINVASIAFDSSTKGNQQLNALIPDGLPINGLPEVCREEGLALIGGAPRTVFGTQSLSLDGDVMDFNLVGALEIESQPVLTELQKLSGFVPNYVTNNDAVTLGFALGLNMDNLVPALTQLWSMFINKEFECGPLIAAQEQAQQLNPAVLSMATGFTKGVKGLSFGLFNLDVEQALAAFEFDALVTLSAENPSVLASLLTSYVPFFQGQTIPDNGEALDVPLPVPFETKVAIKGKHLVVYTGQTAAEEANKLAEQPLEINGLSAATLDYKQFGDLLMAAAPTVAEFQADSDTFNCTDVISSAVMLKGMDIRLSGGDYITEQGLVSDYNIQMNVKTAMANAGFDVIGQYNVDYLDYDCQWYPSGTEAINADGSGVYSEYDEAGECTVFESGFDWSLSFGSLSEVGTTARYREDCSAAWEADDAFDFDCVLMGQSADGFYCLENYDGEETLYRYTRQ